MEQQQEHTMPKFTANERSHYSGKFSEDARFKSAEEEYKEYASKNSKKCSKYFR